jgi:hypothetical protein
MTEPTAWTRLLVIAQEMGLAPAVFRRLSLREWRALVTPTQAALTQRDFQALAERFPDERR